MASSKVTFPSACKLKERAGGFAQYGLSSMPFGVLGHLHLSASCHDLVYCPTGIEYPAQEHANRD